MTTSNATTPEKPTIAAADRLALVYVFHVAGVRNAERRRLVADYGGELLRFGRADFERALQRPLRSAAWTPDGWRATAAAELAAADKYGYRVIGIDDADYPPLLREIVDAPVRLFVRGNLPDPSVPALAIVGTRRPSRSGSMAAFRFGYEAAAAQVPVVSGLALGIDAEAHRGSVAAGGYGLVVLGSAIDSIGPATNSRLAARLLAAGGGIVSEYGPGFPCRRYHFPARNRIISGLVRGVVVVEAPARSGALITADYCADQGRDLFVVADCLEPGGSSSAGTADLAQNGAPAIRSVHDVLVEWGRESPAAGSRWRQRPAFSRDHRQLVLDLRCELAGRSTLVAGRYLERDVE